ncbi:MAG: ribosome biogenesis GTPase Der [bacterium]
MEKIPVLAIVGRPNVGKSTLFNRIIGRKQAIVYDQPGVTRDRNYAQGVWNGKPFQIVDTGGYEADPESDLFSQMRRQVELAIREADLILFVVDGRSGLTADDRDMAAKLRRSGKKVFLAVNKIDVTNHEAFLGEYYELGIQKVFPVSAEHGRGVADMLDEIVEEMGQERKKAAEEGKEKDKPIRVSIIGRPNVGKSTLLNRLFGAPRAVVHPEPGTTRDPLDIEMRAEGKLFHFIDTAGIRKKSHSEGKIEKVSVLKAFEWVEKSDVVLLLIDVTTGLTAQDGKVAQHALDRKRPVLLLVNKWDAVPEDSKWSEMKRELQERFDFLRFVPMVKISAKTGLGVSRIFRDILKINDEFSKRLTTGEVNRVFRQMIEAHPPPTVSGKSLNLFFMTQVNNRPPRFVIFTNHPSLIPKAYERYLIREIRKAFSFTGAPVVLEFKSRKKKRFHG